MDLSYVREEGEDEDETREEGERRKEERWMNSP